MRRGKLAASKDPAPAFALRAPLFPAFFFQPVAGDPRIVSICPKNQQHPPLTLSQLEIFVSWVVCASREAGGCSKLSADRVFSAAMYNLFKYEQEMAQRRAIQRSTKLQMRDKAERDRLANSYASRVNQWMSTNAVSHIDEPPETYREYRHAFRQEAPERHLSHSRVSSKKYVHERDRVKKNIALTRSRILNVNNGSCKFQEGKFRYRHRFPQKEIPGRTRFHTRFTDTTRKLMRTKKDDFSVSCKIPKKTFKFRRPQQDFERKGKDEWKNLRRQADYVWADIPREKDLSIPPENRHTTPAVPSSPPVKMRFAKTILKSPGFRRGPLRRRYPWGPPPRTPASPLGRSAARNTQSAPPGSLTSPKLAKSPKSPMSPMSPGSKGVKMYWKAVSEMANNSRTRYGTAPRLNWTRSPSSQTPVAQSFLKSKYETIMKNLK